MESGQDYLVSANWIHNQDLDHWKDWECSAGVTRIMIDENFDVYSGECLNDYLGNLTAAWNIINRFTVCKQYRCSGCTDDLLISKKKQNHDNDR